MDSAARAGLLAMSDSASSRRRHRTARGAFGARWIATDARVNRRRLQFVASAESDSKPPSCLCSRR